MCPSRIEQDSDRSSRRIVVVYIVGAWAWATTDQVAAIFVRGAKPGDKETTEGDDVCEVDDPVTVHVSTNIAGLIPGDEQQQVSSIDNPICVDIPWARGGTRITAEEWIGTCFGAVDSDTERSHRFL